MPSQIIIIVLEPKGPFGMNVTGLKGVDPILDGVNEGEQDFGVATPFNVEPGEHEIRVRLHGVVIRESNSQKVSVADNAKITVEAEYSWMWGTYQIREK